MKVLLYGGKGWIGSQIVSILQCDSDIQIIYTKVRADDDIAVKEELQTVQPDRVICVIGRTYGIYEGEMISTIDYLEKPGKLRENIRDNLYGPMILAMLCRELNIHMTYIGTGCIFTYEEEKKIFTENDIPNFFGSSYSIVKGFTDRLMHFQSHVLNLRIRMPISSISSSRNLIDKLVKYTHICSIPNSMSVLDDLLPILVRMMKAGETGTFNFVNPGTITHEEILELYKRYVDSTHTYTLMTYEEQEKRLLAGRSNNELDATLLDEKYGPIPHIRESVERILQTRALKK